MTKDFITPLDLDHFDVSTITNLFQLVSDTGLSAPCSVLNIINDSNSSIIISFNGIDDHDYVILQKDRQIPCQCNSRGGNDKALFAKGTKIWVRSGYPAEKFPAGMIYFTGF
jgi:hypothetical protein